jgi:uncharacterized membrane protein
MASIRRWLLAGLLVLVPLAITLWVLDWIVGTLDQTLLILPGSWHLTNCWVFISPASACCSRC